MKIETVVTGTLEENCYVLKKNNTCLVVDPGDDYQKIKDMIGDNKVLGVLITHSHFDHIGALRNFLTKRSIKIFKKSNLEEKEYNIGDFTFKCIYTPGHSADSVTFYFEEEIGRCDLPTGDEKKMTESIQKIKTYSGDIEIYRCI